MPTYALRSSQGTPSQGINICTTGSSVSGRGVELPTSVKTTAFIPERGSAKGKKFTVSIDDFTCEIGEKFRIEGYRDGGDQSKVSFIVEVTETDEMRDKYTFRVLRETA